MNVIEIGSLRPHSWLNSKYVSSISLRCMFTMRKIVLSVQLFRAEIMFLLKNMSTTIQAAVMCIIVHGAIGITPDAVAEMLCTIVLIYGMLMVRKKTGNAWGCVLIFFAYWNAL